MGALSLLLAAAVCMGAPVQPAAPGGLWVTAGPFSGGVTQYDVVRGRFALRAGELRARGLSQKIPWFPAAGTPIGDTLVVTGRTLSVPRRTFTQTFDAASELGGAQRTMFPTVIRPPAKGCWLLTLTSGPSSASIPVWVRPRVR